jgi:hypothetical protein
MPFSVNRSQWGSNPASYSTLKHKKGFSQPVMAVWVP